MNKSKHLKQHKAGKGKGEGKKKKEVTEQTGKQDKAKQSGIGKGKKGSKGSYEIEKLINN